MCPGQGVLGSTRTSRISWIALVEKNDQRKSSTTWPFSEKQDLHRIYLLPFTMKISQMWVNILYMDPMGQ